MALITIPPKYTTLKRTNPPKYTNIKRTIPPNRIGRVEGLLNMRRSVSKGDPIAIAFSGYLLFYIIHDNDK